MTTPDAVDFAALYKEARPQLLALARRLVSNDADAEDVVQVAFISGMRSAGGFRGDARATSWMYRITFNAALMSLRSKKRRRLTSLDDLPVDDAERRIAHVREDDALDLVSLVDRRVVGKALDGALAALNDVDRKVVTMRLRDQEPTEEVAKALGLTVAATKARLHRARRVLQDQLALAC